MKRNLDLIREILLLVEKHNNIAIDESEKLHGKHDAVIEFDHFKSYQCNEIWNAIEIMVSAGFIKCKGRIHSVQPHIEFITWSGHEYLDKIRDKNRWEKIKSKLAPIGDFSREAITQAISQLTSEQIKYWFPIAIYTALVYSFGLLTKFVR